MFLSWVAVHLTLRLVERPGNNYVDQPETVSTKLLLMVCAALGLFLITPYLFIFGSAGFHGQNSSSSEKGWLISWVVCNQLSIFYLRISRMRNNDLKPEHLAVPSLVKQVYVIMVPL
jgi:hypothetical protein